MHDLRMNGYLFLVSLWIRSSWIVMAFDIPSYVRDDVFAHLYGSNSASRELSFDGDIWDFEGDNSKRDVLQGSITNSMFGYSIAVHENKLIVGAMGSNSSKGSALIYYKHDDEVWRLDKRLMLENPVAYDQFGCAVAIYEYTVVVGANKRDYDDGWKADAGAAYIYEKEGARWEMTMDLTPDDATAQDYFGSSVGIHANTTVVGCWGCDSMGTFSGAAYIYSKWDGQWQLNEKIFANDGTRYNWFGISVAIQADLIVVGATGFVSEYTMEKAGAVYAFCNVNDDGRDSGRRYVECAELVPGDGKNGDAFGTSVSIHNEVVVVGAPMADLKNGMTNAGAAYIYYRDVYSDWHFLQKINSHIPSIDGHFGQSIAIYDDLIAVGGYNASGSGAVYLYGEEYKLSKFERDTNALWKLAFILTPESEENVDDFYGFSVAANGATVAVGAHGLINSNGNRRTGGVFMYDGSTIRIEIPSQYDANSGNSSGNVVLWLGVIFSVLFVLLLGIGGALLIYNKNTYGQYFPSNRNDVSPISDWIPSSFSKAFGANIEYSTTSLDSSHGMSSRGMLETKSKVDTVSNPLKNDDMDSIFSDTVDKDQQLLDDSLSKFQLRRQNRISIKKRTDVSK